MRLHSRQAKKLFIPVFACIAILCQSCSTITLRPVSEADKDQAGTYDGTWEVTQGQTAGLQYGPGNWQFSCGGQPGKWAAFTVADGVASLSFDQQEHDTFVSTAGAFRFEVPMNVSATSSGVSDSSISRGAMTMILAGSLEKKDGFLTWGIAEFSNNGCTTPLTYEKL